MYYATGTGVAKNLTMAVNHWLKVSGGNYTDVSYNLALCYETGVGVEPGNQNIDTAANYYETAAEKGHAKAQCCIGVLFANGIDFDKDLKIAANWYRKAADAGLARGQFHLAGCYENGAGVKQNIELALNFYRLAADQGYAEANPCIRRLE